MLYRKMFRDIKNQKAQFIAIFLMIFLGVFIYAGMNSEWNGLKSYSETFYKETNLADVWLISDGFSKDEVEMLQKSDNITKAVRRAVIPAFDSGNKEKKVELYIIEEMGISDAKVIEGETFSPDKEGVWLDKSYAEENGIQVGDSLSLQYNGVTIDEAVKGLILHPEFVYYTEDGSIIADHKNSGYAFVPAETFPYKDIVPFTQIVLKSKNADTVKKDTAAALHKQNMAVIERADLTSYETLQAEIIQHQAFANVFPIVFLLIAVLITLTTVSKMILNQRLQIGILMAVGFTRRKVMFHYLSHILCITLAGAVLGYLTGPLLVPGLIYPMMKSIYVLPDLSAVPLKNGIILVCLSVALCLAAGILVMNRQMKGSAASALRPSNGRYKGKKGRTGRLWTRLNFYAQWNLRDISRNKIRSFMAAVGVAGCMGLLFCAFGIQDSMNYMMYLSFDKMQKYEMRADLEQGADAEQIKSLCSGEAVLQKAVEIKKGEQDKTGILNVLEGTRYMKLLDTKMKSVKLPKDGIALSHNIAEKLNIEEGDTVSWRLIGDTSFIKSKVSSILYTPSAQGITISRDVYETYGFTFTPTSIVGKSADISDLQGVKKVKFLKTELRTDTEQMMEGMMLIVNILVLAAVILGVVVLYNLGTFSYLEKIRELSTLKVLGFKNVQIKKLLRQQNLWLTLTGIIAGLPFGYTLIYTVVSTVGESMDLRIYVKPATYLICIAGTLGLSMLVIILVSMKTRKIDMVSALKELE